MAAMNDMLGNLVAMEMKIGELRKLLLDNKVADGKTASTALKALVDAADTAIQAKSQVAGSDFFQLA